MFREVDGIESAAVGSRAGDGDGDFLTDFLTFLTGAWSRVVKISFKSKDISKRNTNE